MDQRSRLGAATKLFSSNYPPDRSAPFWALATLGLGLSPCDGQPQDSWLEKSATKVAGSRHYRSLTRRPVSQQPLAVRSKSSHLMANGLSRQETLISATGSLTGEVGQTPWTCNPSGVPRPGSSASRTVTS